MRAGALGDVLLLRVAIASLRAAGYDVALLAPAASVPALPHAGACAVGLRFAYDSAAVAAWLSGAAPARVGLAPLLEGCSTTLAVTRDATLLAALRAQIPRVVARDPLPPAGSGPAWAFYAAALSPLGVARVLPPAEVASPEEAVAAEPLLSRLPPRFLALHPGSGSARKNWPAERFARLVEELAAGEPWLLALGPADSAAAERLEALPGAVVARQLPLRVLGALLARASLYVGNDSGVSHLAAAYGVPSLVLFGPTDPDTWAPCGPRVATLRAPDGRLEALEVQHVLEAAVALSSSGAPESKQIGRAKRRVHTAGPAG